MLEKLARAAQTAHDEWSCRRDPTWGDISWEIFTEEQKEEYLCQVRAILTELLAMPERHLVEAARAYHSGPYALMEMRRELKVMIDEILKEGQ